MKTAKKNVLKLGRPNKDFPPTWEDYYDRWKNREITAVQMMNDLHLAKATFYRLAKRWEAEQSLLVTRRNSAAKTVNTLLNVRSNNVDVSELTEVFKDKRSYTNKLQGAFLDFFYEVPISIMKRYMVEEKIPKKKVLSVFNKLPNLAMKNKFKGAIKDGSF